MEPGYIDYKGARIKWFRYGKGGKIVACFHGYGENAGVFAFLGRIPEMEEYSFFCMDLPFHGETYWPGEISLQAEVLWSVIDHMLAAEATTSNEDPSSIAIIGFSLGARVALSLFESRPQFVNRLVLLAPDGMTLNPWYWFATQTVIGNQVFSFTMKHPGWFFGFFKLLNRVGIVNPSVYKFTQSYIGNKPVRDQLYLRWTGFRRLRPDLKRIKSLILAHTIPVRFIYGRHDRIIRPGKGEKFCKGLEGLCELRKIEAGHQVLAERWAGEIVGALL